MKTDEIKQEIIKQFKGDIIRPNPLTFGELKMLNLCIKRLFTCSANEIKTAEEINKLRNRADEILRETVARKLYFKCLCGDIINRQVVSAMLFFAEEFASQFQGKDNRDLIIEKLKELVNLLKLPQYHEIIKAIKIKESELASLESGEVKKKNKDLPHSYITNARKDQT
jgi:hypothetical protein